MAGLDLMGMRFGLERMHALMRELGAPCAGLPAVHVVGTNGKTSVTRMTAAILSASGLRTGAYTSPQPAGSTTGLNLLFFGNSYTISSQFERPESCNGWAIQQAPAHSPRYTCMVRWWPSQSE